MSRFTTKAELIHEMEAEHRRLQRLIGTWNKRELVRRNVVGEWSVKDVLAHLTAWEKLLLGWYRAGVRGTKSAVEPVGMSTRAIHAVNERIYTQNKQHSLDRILAGFERSYKQTLHVVQEIPEEDLFAHNRFPWTGRLTVADYVAGNTCNHYRWARMQIKRGRTHNTQGAG